MDTETSIMATADQLLKKMFSLIEQGEHYAETLMSHAQKLESRRKNFNTAECVGSTSGVVGALSQIGAGAATLFTGGAAAPLLGVAGAVCSGVGFTVSVGTKITEGFIPSDNMEKTQEIVKKINTIQEEIKQLFEKLKAESFSKDPDEVDQHVTTEILKAITRRKSQDLLIDFKKQTIPNNLVAAGSILVQDKLIVAAILAAFSLTLSRTNLTYLGAGSLIGVTSTITMKGSKKLFKQLSKIGLQKSLQGGAMFAGGAVGLAFALPEAIDNWKDLIKKNHVTEASQSLRDTADDILKTCQELRLILLQTTSE